MKTRRRKRSQESSSASASSSTVHGDLRRYSRRRKKSSTASRKSKKSASRVMTSGFWKRYDHLLFEAAKEPEIIDKARMSSRKKVCVAMAEYIKNKHDMTINVDKIYNRMDIYKDHWIKYHDNKSTNEVMSQNIHDNLDFLDLLFGPDARSRSTSSQGTGHPMSADHSVHSVQNRNNRTEDLTLKDALVYLAENNQEKDSKVYARKFAEYQILLKDKDVLMGFSILNEYEQRINYLESVARKSN